MNFNMSKREKQLILLTIGLLLFVAYWILLMGPVFLKINNGNMEIKKLQMEVEQLKPPVSSAYILSKRGLQILPYEEQVSKIVDFLNSSFNKAGVSLSLLHQESDGNRLVFYLQFKTTDQKFLNVVNYFAKIDTILIISKVKAEQENDELVVDMELVSGYLN